MMDNRIAAIKDILHKNGFGGKVYFTMSTKIIQIICTCSGQVKTNAYIHQVTGIYIFGGGGGGTPL